MAVPELQFRLWPPSESTRALLVEKMATNLASVSVFSLKYGRIEKSEAAKHAKRIEEEAFVAAQQRDADSDIALVQLYAKQASQLMLDALKAQGQRENFFDISGRKRAFLAKEEAEELLKPLREPGNAYSKVCLSNWSFGKDASTVAGEALTAVRGNLVDVNLADIVAGRPEAEALEVMTVFSAALAGNKLKSLNLSDNALGEKGVRAFSALLKSQNSLEALYFMNNGISEEAAQAICELLPSVQDLRILHFHNNMSGDGGAEALSVLVEKAILLEDFQFSSTRVAADGGMALARALRAGKCLRRIDLRDNMFGPEVGVALSSTLRLHPDLTDAYLSDLGLEDEGVIAVAEALSEGAPNLRVLELGGNDITAAAGPALANCIRSKKLLTRLSLAENDLKDRGAVIVCKGLEGGHESLKELDLSSNRLAKVGAVAAAQAVANIVGFKLLNLDGNRIPEEGIEDIKELLMKGVAGLSALGSLEENDEDNDEESEGEEEEVTSNEEGEYEANHNEKIAGDVEAGIGSLKM